MAIKYYRLLDLLNKNGIPKSELKKMCGFSSATIAKFSSHEKVSLDVIEKLCILLECRIEDIMEYVPEAEEVVVI